jgi:hypothetical protein
MTTLISYHAKGRVSQAILRYITTKPLISKKLGLARNETQSKIIEIRDLKYQKSMIIVIMILIVMMMI